MKLFGALRSRVELDEDVRRVLDTAALSVTQMGDRIRDLKRWEKDYAARAMGPLR